jgi:hypothetical protein
MDVVRIFLFDPFFWKSTKEKTKKKKQKKTKKQKAVSQFGKRKKK